MTKKNQPSIKKIGIIFAAIFILIAAVGGLVAWKVTTQSHSGLFYLDPKAVTVTQGGDTETSVRFTPGTPVDAVTATVKYDTSGLEFQKVTYEDSPFEAQIPALVENDTVTVQAAHFGGGTVSSDAYVATLHFKGRANGSSDLQIIDANAAVAGVSTNPRYSSELSKTFVILLAIGLSGLVIVLAWLGVTWHRKYSNHSAGEKKS